MYAALATRILEFESEIYTGNLGSIKVKNMEKWRLDIQKNEYEPQGKLQWGPKYQKMPTNTLVEDDEIDDDGDDDDVELEKVGGKFVKICYRDPGEGLGDTMEIDSEDSEDEGISLHDSVTLRTSITNLASALLQVEQGIERRFMKEPFGAPVKESNDVERKIKWGINRLKQWEVSLMQSTSFSQVFLHMAVLHDTILWSRSTNKSFCQVCRKGSDPEKMLLCDQCNGGTHMFCMKPKMKNVPEGNWYCKRCIQRHGLKNETNDSNSKMASGRKRRFILEEDDNSSEISNTSSTAASTSASTSASASVSAPKSNGQRASDRLNNKRLHSRDVEYILEQEDDEADVATEDGVCEEDDEVKSEDEEDEDAVEDDKAVSGDSSEQDDDEDICNVCSYNGSELVCARCKVYFHLECINLKRAPRMLFICSKCKEENKRRSKNNDDTDDDDDDVEAFESRVKRLRHSRSSQRHSANNEHSAQESRRSSNNRRSNRRTGDSLPLNSPTLYKLLEDVMKHEQAWPFLRAVMPSEVPDYYKIIRCPMDLAKVKSKLNMGAYQLNEEVLNDIHLIFSNCDEYNVKGNEVYQAGCALEKYVLARCKELNLPFKCSDMNL